MNLVKNVGLFGLALLSAMVFSVTGFAQDGHSTLSGSSMGAGLGAGLVIIGAALGFGKIGAAALESMARQPETAARVQTAMIVIGALLEGATFFALIVCILVSLK